MVGTYVHVITDDVPGAAGAREAVNAGEALDELLAILGQLRQLLPSDKATWDRQPVLRLAVERLWSTAGSLAGAYRFGQGIASGVEPWSELAGYRYLLAHALPGDISSYRVFAEVTELVEVSGQHANRWLRVRGRPLRPSPIDLQHREGGSDTADLA